MLVLVLTYHYNFNYTSSPAPNGQNEGSSGLISIEAKTASYLKSQSGSALSCLCLSIHLSRSLVTRARHPMSLLTTIFTRAPRLTAARRWFIRAEIFCSSQLPAISLLVFSDQLCSDLDQNTRGPAKSGVSPHGPFVTVNINWNGKYATHI